MFNTLFSLINTTTNHPVDVMSATLQYAVQIVKLMKDNYAKDQDSFDAAIDTFCQILQQFKSKK